MSGPLTFDDVLESLDDLVKAYRLRVIDLRSIAKQNKKNSRIYSEVKLAQAEELEQCMMEIKKIIDWVRLKKNPPINKDPKNPLNGPLFRQQQEGEDG